MMTEGPCSTACMTTLVYVRYRDHVMYHRADPVSMRPQVREALGWLVHDCKDYIIICWDRDAEPPTLKGGDAKASGLVLLRSAILETRVLINEFSEAKSKSFSKLSSNL